MNGLKRRLRGTVVLRNLKNIVAGIIQWNEDEMHAKLTQTNYLKPKTHSIIAGRTRLII